MVLFDRVVSINGMQFVDVTNQTVAGPTYTRKEAERYAIRRQTGEIHYSNNKKVKK